MANIAALFIIALVCGAPSGGPREPDVAVCVTGAVRSMLASEVREAFERNIIMPLESRADYFYHLFVGIEASERGQLALRADAAPGLAQAVAHARRVRLQYEENPFSCEQASGFWWKLAWCTELAVQHAEAHGIVYQTFLSLRPDVVYTVPVPDFSACAAIFNQTRWVYNLPSTVEFFAMSWAQAAARMRYAHCTPCCNATSHEPHDCFPWRDMRPAGGRQHRTAIRRLRNAQEANFILLRSIHHDGDKPPLNSVLMTRHQPPQAEALGCGSFTRKWIECDGDDGNGGDDGSSTTKTSAAP